MSTSETELICQHEKKNSTLQMNTSIFKKRSIMSTSKKEFSFANEQFHLQSSIAQRIKLGLPSNSDVNKRKMELSAYFKKKKFLLILDDVWSAVNLKYLGMEFGEGNDYIGSKVVFSTQNKDLTVELNVDQAMTVQHLSSKEERELFCRAAFKGVLVLHDTDEHTARQVATEYKGFLMFPFLMHRAQALLSRSLWQPKELEFLNLSLTKIEHVPEAISNLSQLQVLDLLVCIKLKSLPSEIGGLVNNEW